MQVESDIAPFKDLLMGLFFMTVGMEISVGIFVGQFRQVLGCLALLIVGKVSLLNLACSGHILFCLPPCHSISTRSPHVCRPPLTLLLIVHARRFARAMANAIAAGVAYEGSTMEYAHA